MYSKKIVKRVFRNYITLNGQMAHTKMVNLEYWKSQVNIGDYLAKVVYNWMLEKKNIKVNQKIVGGKPIHLLTIGSIVGISPFDATIWGSGIHSEKTMCNVFDMRNYCKYDIRDVRGPITYTILRAAGYNCPKVFGDPAVLMPLIYKPLGIKKKYRISIILHLSQKQEKRNRTYHYIDIQTTNYKKFINEIVSSELIISSSLHGIILAESYNIPVIFLAKGRESEFMKYLDWYYSTNRFNIKFAKTLSEATNMRPMNIPNLDSMRRQLIETFPYDLWNSK